MSIESRDVSIFVQMTALAGATGALNLGQGFPDDQPPEVMLEAARQALTDGRNQYPPCRGIPELRQAIAVHQRRFAGLDVDPDTDVMVTAGATEALASTLLALVGPRDEVLTLEPFFDAYPAVVSMAGGRHVTVPLDLVDGRFVLDHDRLRAAFTDRTAVVLLNNPNNPTGFQCSRADLELVVELATRHDATIVTDEVYEHLCFDAPHIRVATLPGASERTLTISSAGKTFSVTGWKVGWLVGPAGLVARAEQVKQWLTFTNAAPLQPAVALGLGLSDEFFDGIRASLMARRDLLCAGLRSAGLAPFVPSAGYFVVADATFLGLPPGRAGIERMAREAGVVGIPYGAFCHPERPAVGQWIRFAHCKSEGVIADAAQRLRSWGHPA